MARHSLICVCALMVLLLEMSDFSVGKRQPPQQRVGKRNAVNVVSKLDFRGHFSSSKFEY